MIDIPSLIRRLQMRALEDRADQRDEVADITQGLWEPTAGTILPGAANAKRQRAYNRLVRQMQTIGPRVMEAKLNAILGNVTWGMNDDQIDDWIKTLDLPSLARRVTMDYISHGITAIHAITPPEGEPRITRLGGYLEPYLNPMDRDEVTGLFQAWRGTSGASRRADANNDPLFDDVAERNRRTTTAHSRWTVRVYDFDDNTFREWTNLRHPHEIGRNPQTEETLGTMPRVLVRELSIDGLPLGEMERATPQIKALWATEARLTLAEEVTAYPMLKVIGGDLPDNFAVGPGEYITLPPGTNAEWMIPGNLQELREQRGLRMERIREDLSLPGGFLGNDSPSGEAFREANIRFRQNTERYASEVSELITMTVMDLGTLIGIEAPQVVINPSKAYDEAERVQNILALFQSGVIPLDVAVNELRTFLPSWGDEEANEWVEEQTAVVRPEDITFSSGGEEGA